MDSSRLPILIAAALWTAFPISAQAQNPESPSARGAGALIAQLKIDIDAFRARFAPGALGLKPPGAGAKDAPELPLGMNYSSDTRSLLMPLDEKQEWGIGLNLEVNKARDVEIAPSGLGLQPKRTPGVVIHRRF